MTIITRKERFALMVAVVMIFIQLLKLEPIAWASAGEVVLLTLLLLMSVVGIQGLYELAKVVYNVLTKRRSDAVS